MKRSLIVSILTAATLLVGSSAVATGDDPRQGDAVWYSWQTSLAPGVTTPQTTNDVTWPQTLIGVGRITPACGTWAQWDEYAGSPEEIAAVVGDGVLTYVGQPEDHAIVQGWEFVYGGGCPPVIEPPVVEPPVVEPPVVQPPVAPPAVPIPQTPKFTG